MSASITWCGHATFKLALADERVIYIDPWLTDNPSCPDEMKTPDRCDLILLTHGHFDHIGDVGALIDKFNPTIVGNFELCAALEKTLGKGTYSGMNTGGTQEVAGVRVSLTRAYHSSSIDTPAGPMYAGMPNGLIIDIGDHAKLYHAGDTDVFSDMTLIAKLHAPTVAILPIGDFFTMGAKGAALAAEMIQPKHIIPCHYQTFPILAQSADEFRDALPADLKGALTAPKPGDAITWTSSGIE